MPTLVLLKEDKQTKISYGREETRELTSGNSATPVSLLQKSQEPAHLADKRSHLEIPGG